MLLNNQPNKGISLKVNIIAWLEFEHSYFKATVQHFSHYITGTPCSNFLLLLIEQWSMLVL